MKTLSKSLPEVIYAAKAKSTNYKYEAGWKKWVDWCQGKNEVMVCPAEPFFVSLYLNFVFRETKKVGAIKTAFYGIRWGHHKVGFDSPTDNPFVKLAFEGTKRLCEHKTQKKEPIESSQLKVLIDEFKKSKYDLMKARTIVISLLGFCGFLRIDELITVQLRDVSIKSTHMSIFLEQSKCDQHREGEKVIVSRLPSEYCPVAFTQCFLENCGIDIDSKKYDDYYLIPRLTKLKVGHRPVKGRGLSYSTVLDLFKSTINEVVDDTKKYGLHSLRSGGASAAANSGVPDRMISKHGRWKSEKGRNTYIKDSLEKRLIVSQSLGL